MQKYSILSFITALWHKQVQGNNIENFTGPHPTAGDVPAYVRIPKCGDFNKKSTMCPNNNYSKLQNAVQKELIGYRSRNGPNHYRSKSKNVFLTKMCNIRQINQQYKKPVTRCPNNNLSK